VKFPFAVLFAQLDELMLCDQHRLRRRLQAANKIKDFDIQQQVVSEIASDIVHAKQRISQRQASGFAIVYPEDLPISQRRQEIYRALDENQVLVIAGETGSGKTTQLPKICLELGRGIKGLIGHTQPRRLAVRTVAQRIAEELKTCVGGYVGYKVRFNDQVGENTRVKLMTDGILLAEIQQDRWLRQYDTLIIDEAHERSLNIDFILGYLRQLLPKRPDLKLVITSATIDPQRFSRHFYATPIIEVSGRNYPVDVRYRPIVDQGDERDRDQLQAIVDAVHELEREKPGDILIFMSAEREIHETAEALKKQNLRHTEVLPLYARLSHHKQNRVFHPSRGAMLRRIILATNVAETSLTVPGIKYVIDPGYARISRYSFRTKVQRLPIEAISQASANQRKGRCGRVSEGICIRLYSEQDFLSRLPFTDPEILRTNLASVILQMTAIGLGDIKAFPFIDPPDKRNIQDGVRLLVELGAIRTADNGHQQLTKQGRQLAQLPIDPRLARMVLAAQKNGCVREVMIIASALSIQDPRERPLDKQQAADEKHRRFADKNSDFLSFVHLWDQLLEQQKTLSSGQFRQLCRRDFLSYLRLREWQDIHRQLSQTVKLLMLPVNSVAADHRTVHSALLTGLLSHIGQKDSEKMEFTGAHSARFAVFPASQLFKKPPKWIMVAQLLETSRLWGRIAARIEPEWIEPLAPHLVKYHYSDPHWEKSQGAVMANEKVTLFGLPIVASRKINYGAIDPPLCRELFIRHGLVEGQWQTSHAFFHANLQLLAEVEAMEHKSRRRDILVDDETLFTFYEQRIDADVVSARHFDSWWRKARQVEPELLNFEKTMLVKEGANHIDLTDHPDFWQQGALTLPLSYQFEPGSDVDGVTVHLPLAILNQISDQGFDWQVPGLRRALIIALIKSLPKSLRRHFIPAPNYADAFLTKILPPQNGLPQSLLEVLEHELRQMTGVTLSRNDWQWEQVPSHFKITFRVLDDKNHIVREGKNLAKIKKHLQQQVQKILSAGGDKSLEKKNLVCWNFGTLPACYAKRQGGYEIKAYPALVDEKKSVAIRLFETESQQQQAMWRGTRRLLLLNISAPIKYLHEKLPNKTKLGLYFNPYGKVVELIDDCIACGVDYLIAQHGGLAWQQSNFIQLQEKIRAELNDTVVKIATQVEQILNQVFLINKPLKGQLDIKLALNFADIKAQLAGLIYPGFVSDHGWQRLTDILRYLRAIEQRLEKLRVAPQRDHMNLRRVQQIMTAWQQWIKKLPLQYQQYNEVKAVRWMIEELRVSLFAQQLGTAYRISEQRIVQTMDQLITQLIN